MPRLLADRTRLKQPSPVERELLDLLSEESGEVVKAIGKIGRHGLDSYHPTSGSCNRLDLELEIGDFLAAVRLLVVQGVVSIERIREGEQLKLDKVLRYLHHVPESTVCLAARQAKQESPDA